MKGPSSTPRRERSLIRIMPQRLIVETASVSAGLPYRLRGPGIPGEKDINMAA